MNPKTKKLIAREIFVVSLCFFAAFYLKSHTAFAQETNQFLWALKVACGLFVAYYFVHFIIKAFETLIGILVAVIVVVAIAALLMAHLQQPKGPVSEISTANRSNF